MLLKRGDFFPSRKRQFRCAGCGKESLLPTSSVLVGVVVMLVFMAFALGFARPIIKPADGMETAMDFVWAAAAFLGIVLASTWLAAWTCGRTVDHLTPWPPPKRSG